MAHFEKSTKKEKGAHNKQTVHVQRENGKKTTTIPNSSENKYIIWIFQDVARDGKFAFVTERDDMNHRDLLSKIVVYSNRTWNEVRLEKHDNGKSKHHYIGDSFDNFSKEARDSVRKTIKDEETELIYSFRLDNLHRVIGLRIDEKFFVKWYDPRHEFYPSDP